MAGKAKTEKTLDVRGNAGLNKWLKDNKSKIESKEIEIIAVDHLRADVISITYKE